MRRLAIIGGGAWGAALAAVACRAGSLPVLWARDPAVVEAVNERHENPYFLPDVTLDPAIVATSDLRAATESADAALLVPGGRWHLPGLAPQGSHDAALAHRFVREVAHDVVANPLHGAPILGVDLRVRPRQRLARPMQEVQGHVQILGILRVQRATTPAQPLRVDR